MKRKRLGEILQDRGKISAESLQQLFKEQEGNKAVRLGELILERGLVDKPSLVKALEEVSRVPYFDCTAMQCEEEALKIIPKPMAVRLDILPVRIEDGRLLVVMAEPQNVATIDELRFTTGKDIIPRFGFRAEILPAIVRNYDHFAGGLTPRSTNAMGVEESSADIEFISTSSRQANREAIQEIQAELTHRRTPAVRLVSEMIRKAMAKQASDIHIEPQATLTTVRVRVDGVLRELETVPRNLQNSLVSRIKILADMDIAERRRMGASWWRWASGAWTCASPRCPHNTVRRL
jgi:type II secretory ATPase GspE/PulE/Tfp pilus assembly ATPase PilB-like protein